MPNQIVYAEDDIMLRRLMIKFLEKSGFQLTAYEDGQELYNDINKGLEYKLLLLDLSLPGRDGEDIAKLAKQKNPDKPVIIMSGYIRNISGADYYISKNNFAFGDLVSKIEELLAVKE